MSLRPFIFALLWMLAANSPAAPYKVLVFSKTTGFRHASIPDGVQCVRRLGTNNNFTVDATENAAVFTFENLRQYRAVVFLLTTGDILDANQQAAFESYIRAGGGYVGVHSASDTEYSWPWYGQLVGAYFQNHPANQTATVRVADHAHPSTAHLPDLWVRFDEWYNFPTNNHPRGRVHVLATVDERTYAPGAGTMGFDHPIAWCHEFDGGRSWYTAGGHTSESYSEPLFQQHLLGGIEWAARVKDGEAGATSELNFQKVVLDATPSNPMELAVAPDGRVFYIERAGRLKIYLPAQNQTVVAGALAVDTGREDGLLGLALDPGFDTNQWVYLFYSPAGAAAKQHVSRFTMSGNVMDPGSERILLEIPTQRSQCCHSAGSLAFGPDGSLYIATGDNTNPFDSSGFAPIDERPGRSAWDAQKSSSNMDDLRGKILRIRPQADGTYTIPAGNLFSAGGGRPEIFVMGCRNPFRISVDQRRGWLYWGDVGPDANAASASRGPAGQDEWNQARSAGNYGWPYFVGDNKAYIEYDFATSTSLAAYNANAPTNNSPNNTGGAVLPPARPAWIWYPYGNSAEFPEVTGGSSRTAMAGPVYYFSTNLVSARKLPAYYDRTLFVYEWSRNWLREVKLDGNGNILKINPFLKNFQFRRPMDLELGPDGALYLIEWGTAFNGNNADAKIVRLDYLPGQVERVGSTTLAPTGATWKYLDNGSDQGTSWTGAGFNDASWKSGVGKFGTNDPANTRIEIGPVDNRWITTYFRQVFNVTNAESISGLIFNVLRDDGVVVHLNGSEAFRMNMPNGPLNYLTAASANVANTDEARFFPTNTSPALLRAGTNLLAVELHQSGTNTTDAGFELSLAGTVLRNLHPAMGFQASAGNFTLTWTAINFALEAAEDLDGPWTEVPPTTPGSYGVPSATGNRFFRLRRYP